MAFPTTLIIGLGGVGSSIVEKIYRKFDASHPTDIDRRNVGFLCMDTDDSDIRKRRAVMPEGSVIKTSSDMSCTVGGYIDRIKDKTTATEWFDLRSQHLLSMSLNEGAGQVRMASRLASMASISENKLEAINNSIKNLLKTEPERHSGNNIKIHIVCSLAGGTGAGSFLQTAYYVKNAMKEQNALAPKISGYFLLADVLCNDRIMGFSDAQKENVRSNTYACVKELMAFCNNNKASQIEQLSFEYRMGQKAKALPTDAPYDFCFLTDFFGANGGNLMNESRYEEQAVEFIYMNAFEPIGDNFRQKSINDVRQMIERDGASRFASYGVSKLVYPVDDIIKYFAYQRVIDNLSGTWLRIDKDFEERLAEYKKNIDQGIRTTEPNRGKHFMQQVEALATTGAGREGMEFRKILESTKTYTDGREGGIPKARAFMSSVDRFVQQLVNANSELRGLHETCTVANPNFTKNTGFDNDLSFVARRERELEDYRKAVLSFIDGTKSYAIKQCLTIDYDAEGYVSKNPQTDGNHLNTYILEKEKELHPLAVRYLLYDIQALLKQGLEKKKAENKKLDKQINEDYKKAYDNQETKDRIEDARESLKAANDKSSGIFGTVSSKLFGSDAYKQAKENYEARSKSQAQGINKYATEKLLEETYAGLLMQINLLIEEEENFFGSLPNAIYEANNTLQSLLKQHDANNNPCVSYVLASEQDKKDLYEDINRTDDSVFFPTELSAALYRSVFENMISALESAGSVASRRASAKAKKAARLAANQKIIEDCIAFQKELIREKNPQYSEMNVLAALKKEAEFNGGNAAQQHDYMLRKFHAFRDRAEIWGPDNLDANIRYINAWGLNPECLDSATITREESDELFGSSDVTTNVATAATQIVSERFSPFEICRVNAVTLLGVETNFKNFLSKEKTDLSDESQGTYYMAYKEVIERVNRMDSKTFSPHLDKHWHLPAYMPNIGFTQADEIKKVFRALYWGLLLGNFKSESRGGDSYWKFVGDVSYFLKDIDGKMVLTGNTLKYSIDRLFSVLTTNPEIIKYVAKETEKLWKNAKDQWLQEETDDATEYEKMRTSKIVQTIVDFRFNLFPKEKQAATWFGILSAKENTLLYSFLNQDGGLLKSCFFDELMERLINIFGPSGNTYKVCEYIFKHVDKNNIDHAMARLEKFKEEGRFSPNF